MSAHNTLILIILATLSYMGQSHPINEYNSIGTVLFTPTDLKKTHWHKSELALLQARIQFQKLIPPPNFIDPTKDYIDKLLSYFRDAFLAIKREANDPALDSIMTTALSDTIGGYLKLWILPITKFAFYGGTVSYDNAYKIFNFYDEIKKYLGTDGSGWRAPDDKILNSISVSIPRPGRLLLARTRCSKDPCEHFAYFERTPNGFTIPLPTVNWADNTMFIPIKNDSFVSLSSPKYNNLLMKYYTNAKHCLQSRNTSATQEFDERFQMWLSEDVVPHLMDENLYVALGSVLSLVNRDKSLYDSINDEYQGTLSYILLKLADTKACIESYSKKVWFISLILLIEIIWCVFALRHTCFKNKTETNMPGCDNLTLYFKSFREQSHDKKSTSVGDDTTDKNKYDQSVYSLKQYSGSYSDIIGGGIKLHQKLKSKKSESAVQVPSKDVGPKHKTMAVDARSHTSISSRISSNEVFTIINEVHPQIQNCISNDIHRNTVANVSNKSSGAVTATSFYHKCNCETSQDSPEEQDETITLFRKSQRSIERAMFESEENTTQLRRSISERPKRTPTLDLVTFETRAAAKVSGTPVPDPPGCGCCKGDDFVCPCNCTIDCAPEEPGMKPSHEYDYTCMNVQPQIEPQVFSNKKTETVTQTQRTLFMCVDQQTEANLEKHGEVIVQQVETKKDYVIKSKDGKRVVRQPYLEIKIDRPDTQINVDISGIGGTRSDVPRKHPHSRLVSPRRSTQSRISKRLVQSKDQQEPNEHYRHMEKRMSLNESHCEQKVIDYEHENNVLFAKHASHVMRTDTRTVLHETTTKSTREQSTEAAPKVVDDDTYTHSRYNEQATGSNTILPYIEQGANTSGGYIAAFSKPYVQPPNQTYTKRRGYSEAALLRLGSSPQKLQALNPNTIDTSEHEQNKEVMVRKTDYPDDCDTVRLPECPSTKASKIKKRVPGIIPKYLKEAKIRQGDQSKHLGESEVKPEQKKSHRPERSAKQIEMTDKHRPRGTSSPVRKSPTSSIKSACSPLRRSPTSSMKYETMSQYTNKSADAASYKKSASPLSKAKNDPTPGIPTKTKIPVSPRKLKRISEMNRPNTDQYIGKPKKDNFEHSEVKIELPKSATPITDRSNQANAKKKPKSMLKYTKPYAPRNPDAQVTINAGVKPAVLPRVLEFSEAQKVISDVMKQADLPQSKKKVAKFKSYIPRLLKREAADDCDLRTKKTESSKLNITL